MALNNNKQQASLLVQRAEKLVSALYRVTDFIPDEEPLKWKMRDLGLDLLVAISNANRDWSEDISGLAEGIVLLCELGRNSGGFSEMNFSILKFEFDALRQVALGRFDSQVKDFLKEAPEVQSLSETSRIDQGETVTKITQSPKKRSLSPVKDKSNRREQIMEFIRRSGDAGIKDIVGHLKDYGEKTIQRELKAMVDLGVIEKTGDRRWSRYKVASSPK